MRSLVEIIGNPAARGSSMKKIERAERFFRDRGFDSEILLTEKRGDAELFARDRVKKNPFLIIAAGGDGTVNEVMNGMAHSDTPLGLLPLGTTNVLAKELGIPEDIEGALKTAVSRPPRRVSLGKIAITHHSLSIHRYFCLMAGIGFDAKAVFDVNRSLKKISGRTAYVISGLKNFLAYDPEELCLHVNGREYAGYEVVIGKSSRYGGHFRATPDADLGEPSLYTCIFQGKRRADLLRYVFGVVRGTHLKADDVMYLKSMNVEVQGTAHVQIDGDYLGVTPAQVTVEKDILRVVY